MDAAAGWIAVGVVCMAFAALVVLSAIAYAQSARTGRSMEGDR